MIILSFITTPLNLFLLEERLKTDYYFWKETRYEISLDTKVPDNVARVLKRDNPDFVYTNLYYIESPEGNAYFFQDKNDDRELGYTIAEDIS